MRLTEVRDELAAGIDKEALRFQAFDADRILRALDLRADEKLLDVFTGTGVFAMSAAQTLTAGGRVTAIDTAEPLLEKLEGKIRQFGIANIDVQNMSAQRLDFRRDYFHHVVCSLGFYWCPDPLAALREWWRVLRPGGRVVISGFARGAFSPYAEQLLSLLREQRGDTASLPWEGYTDEAPWRMLLEQTGFADTVIHGEAIRYHLPDVQSWLEVVRYSGLWCLLAGLDERERARIQARHLAEIERYKTPDGLLLEVPVWQVEARKR